MILTSRQKRVLETVEFFIPDWVNWDSPYLKYYDPHWNSYPLENKKAISAEEAFFLFTERGIGSKEVSDRKRFMQLFWGQKWMATQEKMWREWHDSLLLEDFDDDPDGVRKMVKKILSEKGFHPWRKRI